MEMTERKVKGIDLPGDCEGGALGECNTRNYHSD